MTNNIFVDEEVIQHQTNVRLIDTFGNMGYGGVGSCVKWQLGRIKMAGTVCCRGEAAIACCVRSFRRVVRQRREDVDVRCSWRSIRYNRDQCVSQILFFLGGGRWGLTLTLRGRG